MGEGSGPSEAEEVGMGATRDSARGAVLTAVAFILAAFTAWMSPVHAHEPGAASTGPVVAIVGDGGVVQAAGANVTITGTASRVDAAGARVEVNATVSGPVRAAGALVTVTGSAEGDLKAAGGSVEVKGRFGGRVYLGGAAIRFDGTVARGAEAVAASIEFGPATDIAGRLSALAAYLTVAGKIGGKAELGGATVFFNAAAVGDVTIEGGRVTIGPLAVIGGDLTIRTLTPPTIDPGAKVAGQTIVKEPAFWWLVSGWTWKLIFAVMMAAGTILAGAILIGAGRGAFEDALGHATLRPFSSGLIGLLTLVLLTLIAVVLMATIIGFSFGFALLLLMPFLIVAGHAVVATCIGVWIFDRTGEPRSYGRLFVYLLAGAILMALVWLIPWAGGVIVGLAIVVGTGAWVRSVAARLRRRSALV
jgi:hypothetical protein